MVLALLADGRSILRKVLLSGDTLATLRAIQQLGAEVDVKGDVCTVKGGELICPEDVVNVENSGTTLRLIAGVVSLLPCTTILTGDESIRQRPMQPLIDALMELGVQCASLEGNGKAPLVVLGPNEGKITHIRGDVSSQFISSLLISSPVKEVDTDLILTTPLKSRPYVDITLEMMRRFGAKAEELRDGFHVPGGQFYDPVEYTIPGDYSSAAFPLAAGVLAGRVSVSGLDPKDKQGDRRIVGILSDFGARIDSTEERLTASAGQLRAREVDLADSPDLFPIVCVLATQAKGRTRIYNAEHVRLKESDRIRSTTDVLKRMGADVEEAKDGCVVDGPCRLKGAEVDSLGDHRILMAAAVAALVAEGATVISEGECYKISYPSFIQDMRALGADMEMIG
jgi:3-phosphoshikimate 1-carboxyvinyltransferase